MNFLFYERFTNSENMSTTIKWVVMKHHKKEDGTYNPKVQITHKRTTAYIPTAIFTSCVRFKRGSSSGSVTEPTIEESLNDIVKKYRRIINEKCDELENMESAKEVKEYIVNYVKNGDFIDFIDFSRHHANNGRKKNTAALFNTRINSFQSFVKEETGNDYISVQNITSRLLGKYAEWLRKNNLKNRHKESSGLCSNTIVSYIGTIRVLFNACKNEYNDYDNGHILIANDPFRNLNLPKTEETRKRALTIEEIRKIYDFHSLNPVHEMTRDLLILSFCLAGMNLVDIYNCPPINDRVEYTRQKTGDSKKEKPFLSLEIHPIAAPLIDKWRDKTGKRGFSLYSYYKNMTAVHEAVRRGIMAIRKLAGIEDLTFYSMRHSFATIARNDCNISMEDVALCLTHKSGFDMTDKYIKKDFSRVDKAIKKVVDLVLGYE